MVRQWQELLHGGRYSESYSDSLPDFVKLAEAFGGKGMRVEKPAELDGGIRAMIDNARPGDRRLPGRPDRELLPDDPVGCGAQRDDARTGRQGGAGLGRRHGAGLEPGGARWRAAGSDRIDGVDSVTDKQTIRRHTISVTGRQRAGHPRARRRPVLRARLQHRQPDRGRDRRDAAPVAHHDRHQRHAR